MQTNNATILLLVLTALMGTAHCYDSYCVCPRLPEFEGQNNLDIFTLGADMSTFMDFVKQYAVELPGMIHKVNKRRGRVEDVSPAALKKLGTTRSRENAVSSNFFANTFNHAIETMVLEEKFYTRDQLHAQFHIPSSKQFDGHDQENATSGQFEHYKFYSFLLNLKLPDLYNYKNKNDADGKNYGMRWDQSPETTGQVRFLVVAKQYRDPKMSGYKLSFHLSNNFVNEYANAFKTRTATKIANISTSIMDKNMFRSLTGGHEVSISKYHADFIPATICNNFMIFYSKVITMFTGQSFSGNIKQYSEGCGDVNGVNAQIEEQTNSLNSFFPDLNLTPREKSPLDNIDPDTIHKMIEIPLLMYNQTEKTLTKTTELPGIQFDIYYKVEMTYLYIFMLIYKQKTVIDSTYLLFKDPNSGGDVFTLQQSQLDFLFNMNFYQIMFDAFRIFMRYFYVNTAIDVSVLIINPDEDFEDEPPIWYIIFSQMADLIYGAEGNLDKKQETLFNRYEGTLDGFYHIFTFVHNSLNDFDSQVQFYSSNYSLKTKDERFYFITLTHLVMDFLYWQHPKGIFFEETLDYRILWFSIMENTISGAVPPEFVYSLDFLVKPIAETYDTENDELLDIDVDQIRETQKSTVLVEMTTGKKNNLIIKPMDQDLVEPRDTGADLHIEAGNKMFQTGNNTMGIKENGMTFLIQEEFDPISERTHEESQDSTPDQSAEFDELILNFNKQQQLDTNFSFTAKQKSTQGNLRSKHNFGTTKFFELNKTDLKGQIDLTVSDGDLFQRDPETDRKTLKKEIRVLRETIKTDNEHQITNIDLSEIEVQPFKKPEKIVVTPKEIQIVEKIIHVRDPTVEKQLNDDILKLNSDNAEINRRHREASDKLLLLSREKETIQLKLDEEQIQRTQDLEHILSVKEQLNQQLKENDDYKDQIIEIERNNQLIIEQNKRDEKIAQELAIKQIMEREQAKFKQREAILEDLHDHTSGRSLFLKQIIFYLQQQQSEKFQPYQIFNQFEGSHIERLLKLIFVDHFNTDENDNWGDLEYPLDQSFVDGLRVLENVNSSNRQAWNEMMIRMIALSTVLKGKGSVDHSAGNPNYSWMLNSNNLLYEYEKTRMRKKTTGNLEEPAITDHWKDQVRYVILKARYKIAVAIRDFFMFATSTGIDYDHNTSNTRRVAIFDEFHIRVDKDYRVLYDVTINEDFKSLHEPDFDFDFFVLRELLVVIFSQKQDPLSEEKLKINISSGGENVGVERDMRDMFAQLCEYKPFLDEAMQLSQIAQDQKLKEKEAAIQLEFKRNELELQKSNLRQETNVQSHTTRLSKTSNLRDSSIRIAQEYEKNPQKLQVKVQEINDEYAQKVKVENMNFRNQTQKIKVEVQTLENTRDVYQAEHTKITQVIDVLDSDIQERQNLTGGKSSIRIQSRQTNIGVNVLSDQLKTTLHKDQNSNFNFAFQVPDPNGIKNLDKTEVYDNVTMQTHTISQSSNLRGQKVVFQKPIETEAQSNLRNGGEIRVSRSSQLVNTTGIKIGSVANLRGQTSVKGISVSQMRSNMKSQTGLSIRTVETKIERTINPSSANLQNLYRDKSKPSNANFGNQGFLNCRRRALMMI